MKFKELQKKIESSEEFKSTKNKFPELELCAGFFINDFSNQETKQTLDYKIQDKVFTFELINDLIEIKEDELMDIPGRPKLEKINPIINLELKETIELVKLESLEQGIHQKFQKIIAVLQGLEEKTVWNLTCILDDLIILNLIFNTESKELIKFEKKSLSDIIQKR